MWRPRTRQSATEKLRYAVDHFGDRQIVTIRKSDVQAFLAGISQTLAPNTVRSAAAPGGHLAQAVDDRLITVNPCQGVRLAKVERQVVLPLSHADVVALYDGAAPWFRVAIVIGAGLGLRQSEAAGLTMDRVDFLRRAVRVDRRCQQATGTRPGAFAPTKTAACTRIIPVGEWVLDGLNLHLEQFGAGDGGVVVHTEGRPVDAARWGHYMWAARKHAGVSDRMSFHDLRHFFRLGAHRRRLHGEAGPGCAGARVGPGHPRRLRAPVAG